MGMRFANRYKGAERGGALNGFLNCVLDRVVYFDCVVEDLTHSSMLAVTCATRGEDAPVNYLFETTSK